ncbi:RNA polymerase sigma factor [Micromonospora sp. NPDC048868]|uniref:RNA polymerase sigma factor n=1 Tax=Micromonospora sp. NPDC048868 TaxID=3364258 RepID=UPI0037138DCB
MDIQGSSDLERFENGATTLPPTETPASPGESPSDIQLRVEAANLAEASEFDPTSNYVKEIQDGRIRALTPLVHTAAPKAPKQGDGDAREGDRLLVARLAKNNFAGPEYDLVAERLVIAGHRYCRSWIKSGKMSRKCREVGRPVGVLPEGVDRQDVDDLATDTAVEGAALFRRVALIGGRWRPDGGASLLTYYIGACIQVYPGIYRKWHREYRRRHPVEVREELPEAGHGGVEDYIVLTAALTAELDEATWVALKMRAEGASYADIAEMLGRTPKAVENLLRRGRPRAMEIIERSGGHHV